MNIADEAVKKQEELVFTISKNITMVKNGKLMTNDRYFEALKECFLASLSFAFKAELLENNSLKEGDVMKALTENPVEPKLALGSTRVATFALNINLATSYIIDSLISYENPSMVKKFIFMDNIVRLNLNPSFRKLSKGFQIYGALAGEYGRDHNDFFSTQET